MTLASYLVGVAFDYTVHVILTSYLVGVAYIYTVYHLNVTTPPSSGKLVLHLAQHFYIYHLNITSHPFSRRLVLHLTQHTYISMSQLYYQQQSFISLLLESNGLTCFHHTF